MAREKEPMLSRTEIVLATHTTKLVIAKAQGNTETQSNAIIAIVDILANHPNLIDDFVKFQSMN